MFNAFEAYHKKGAVWFHSGSPVHPHAVLTSGEHTDRVYNSRLIIEDGELLFSFTNELLRLWIHEHGGEFGPLGCVVGPQTGATILAKFLAQTIAGDILPWASPAKHFESGKKSFVWEKCSPKPEPGQCVLLCEDVIKTGGSVLATAAAVEELGARPLPWILTFVNRTGKKEIQGFEIVALIDDAKPGWQPGDCPLCQGGSQAIEKPKEDMNWLRLMYPHADPNDCILPES